jgi:hypothetical protein
VKPTVQTNGVVMNDDQKLEQEADSRGRQAEHLGNGNFEKNVTGDADSIGNNSSPALSSPVQAMLIPYSRRDLGHDDDAPAGDFLAEKIGFIKFSRANIPAESKREVDSYGDGAPSGAYNHYVPFVRIQNALVPHLEGKKRSEIINLLDPVLRALGIAPSVLDPARNRVAFDTWVEWAVEHICDWPRNIYRWPSSTGDSGGTGIDAPTGGPPAALVERLKQAANALHYVTSVSVEAGVSR